MTKIHNILIVPDKFKGSLSAAGVADALEAAVRQCMVGGRQAKVVKLPMADGGDGSMEVVEAALDGACDRVMVDTFDALMRPVQAPLLLFDGGRQAFIEMAKVCGLAMLAPEERNPEKTTTYGLGVLLAAAQQRGCEKIVIGIGGSATNDGGEGLLRALDDVSSQAGHKKAGICAHTGGKQGVWAQKPLNSCPSHEPHSLPLVAALPSVGSGLDPESCVLRRDVTTLERFCRKRNVGGPVQGAVLRMTAHVRRTLRALGPV